MENFNIEVEDIKYIVKPNPDGTFSLLRQDLEVINLRRIHTAGTESKWETNEGYKNQLVDKIGAKIDQH